jgi:drug/metabolite transporter (DMT)-like permease
MYRSLKPLSYGIGCGIFYAIGYAIVNGKLKGVHKLITICVYSGIIFVSSTLLCVIGYFFLPQILQGMTMPTRDQWLSMIQVGIVFTLADILLIGAHTAGGTIPGIVPIMTATTVVAAVVFDYLLNRKTLDAVESIGVSFIVIGVLIMAGHEIINQARH